MSSRENIYTKHLKGVFISTFVCINTLIALSQGQLNFKTLTVEDGLSNGDVNCIAQDSQGFIWIGTTDGLNRFDGYEFKVFRRDISDSTSLISSTIRSILYSKRNELWIGTDRGLCKYDSESGKFKNFNFLTYENYIIDIIEDKNGFIWIATASSEIIKLDPFKEKSELVEIKFDENTGLQQLHKIMFDSEGYLWVTTSKGVIKYDVSKKQSKIYTTISTVTNKQNSFENSSSSICELNSQKVLVSSWNVGLFSIDKTSGKITPLFTGNKYRQIQDLYKNDEGNIFIGLIDGYALYKQKTESIELFYKTEGNSLSLLGTSVKTVLIDKDKNLWLGHDQLGISLSIKQKAFGKLNNNPGTKIRLTNNEVTTVLKDSRNNLWVGYWSGNIDKINRETGKIERIYTKNADRTSYSGTIFSIIESREGEIWMSSYTGGLQRYNNLTGKFEIIARFQPDNQGLSSNDIRTIFENDDGKFWLTTQGYGIDVYSPETGNVVNYRNEPNNPNSLSNNWVFDIEKDKDNHIWIATSYGVSVFDPKLKSFTNYFSKYSDKSSLASNVTNYILCDSKGSVWIGTNEGLSRFIPDSGIFKSYTIKDGLPNNCIQGMHEDNLGNIWLSTSYGISRFNPESGKIKNYFVLHGLSGNDFFVRSSYASSDGELFFGSKTGLTYFYPSEIIDDTISPTILFTDLQILNQPVVPGSIYNGRIILHRPIFQTDKVILKYTEKIITISFAALNYGATENTQYAYRLIRFNKKSDTEWNYIGQRRHATYTNLTPGEYTFQIIATNNDGVWSKVPKELIIEIIPPFWNTIIFKVGVFLLIIFSIYLFFRIRYSYIKNKNIELEKKVKERTFQLYEANSQLEERQNEIETKSEKLVEQAQRLQEVNQTLEIQKLELKELNATKDKFFSLIAHDLKGPFNTILGFGELLSTRLESLEPEKIKLFVDSLFNSSLKVYDLLENLLQWSRSQTNSIAINPVNINLKVLVGVVFHLLEENATVKNIKLVSENIDDLIVYADENTLKTVLINLVSNAIKFTEKGSITISCKRNNTENIISVADTGIGMDSIVMSKIFKIDESVSTIGTRGEEGTGLGLIICKEFVEKNKGKIWVESTVGKGTTFYISLPVHANHN